jgi:hypothetical protein
MTSTTEAVASLSRSQLNLSHAKNNHSSISIQIQDTMDDHDEDLMPTRYDHSDEELDHFLRPSDAEETALPERFLGSAEQAIAHIYDIGR